MSRPKYFIKTEVNVATGRSKWAVVKGFANADSIGRADSKEAATKLCEEFERLTDEIARLKESLNKMTNTPAEADGVEVIVSFWTKCGSRLPSSYKTFWMTAAKEGKQP